MLEQGTADKTATQTAPSFQQDQKTKLDKETRAVGIFQIQDLICNFH